ncbi:MAG: MFS transporter [Gemmataceae bacterium]|nr:MFS transporter [Gemmataceae bacterium]MDW8265222.1 MFS transporter [Gemmataceae bacterium]
MNERAVAVAARPTRVRYVVLAWICSLSMLTYIDRVCIKEVRPAIQRSLTDADGRPMSNEDFAWVFSAFALSYSLFEVPSGWLADRIGARKVLSRIVLCWSFFTAATGLAWNWFSLVLFRFLFGAGEAGAYPTSGRALRNWFSFRQRGLAQGAPWIFGRWGGALAPMLIAAAAAWLGWRGAFILFGLVGVVWVVFFWWWFRDHPREHPGVNEAELLEIEEGRLTVDKPAPLAWGQALRSPTLWILCLMYFCSNAGWCLFITWAMAAFAGVLHLDGWGLRSAAGAPLFFGGIACGLGGLFTDRQVQVWGRRWGRTLQGAISYALGGLFFLIAVTQTNPLLAVGALCLASFGKDFAMAASWSTTIDIGHRYSGTIAGFMNMIGNLGTVFSPPIVAWLARISGTAESSNWKAALYYSAAMFFVASVCWLFINPRRVIVYSPEHYDRLKAEGALA